MTYEMNEAALARIDEFFSRIGKHLRDRRQRASFAIYTFGLLGDGERKSVEPIAARACPLPADCKRMQNRLLDFLSRGHWQDWPIRLEAARYAIEAMSMHEKVHVWVIDDTGFLKQGRDSVGVHRQYTGSAGKKANCQIGVSLSVATAHAQVPIDFELYIPESWTSDPERRKKARIPEDYVFKTKIELALDMIDRAAAAGIPGDVILADSAYGDSVTFRGCARLLGFDIAVGIRAPTKVWLVGADNQVKGQAVSAQQLGMQLGPKAFRRCSWREGTNGKMLSSRFCFRRVKVAADDGSPIDEREELWLMMEWPKGEPTPTKFVLTSLPGRMAKKQIVRTVKERWKTERVYQEMKGELGLDHYEGRSYPGWHHHVTVAICCYAFIVSERMKAFPPCGGRQSADCSFTSAA